MAKESRGGSKALQLMVLLAIVGGAGTWNYRRNVAFEDAEYRPFRNYTEQDLASLRGAYEQEAEVYEQHMKRTHANKVRVREAGLIGEQVREFERVQRIGREKRRATSELAERQVTIEQLQHEQRRRDEERDKLMLFLRRVGTYRS